MTSVYKLPECIEGMQEGKQLKYAMEQLVATSGGEMIKRFAGNCVSASDIIQNVLGFYGIKAKTHECQAFAMKAVGDKRAFSFIGLNDVGVTPNHVDTHVIVITQTEPPLLIDGSLGYMLPSDEQILIRPLTAFDPDVIGEFEVGDITLQYRQKRNIRLPGLHQKNLLEKMQAEQQQQQRLTFLQRVVTIIATFSMINFCLNMAQIYLKLK